MKKSVFCINIFFFVLISVGNFIFSGQGGIGPLSSLAVKGITSGLFALLGFINLIYMLTCREKKFSFAVSMVAGLVFAMLGDIFLGFNFILGAGLFALGHVLYFVGYCFLIRMRGKDFLFCGVIFTLAALFITLFPLLEFDAPMFRWVCLVYALIISFMAGKAISNFVTAKSVLNAILMVGSVMFFFSDLMLVFDWFTPFSGVTGDLCMATYYPAQWLLAFSVFVAVDKES